MLQTVSEVINYYHNKNMLSRMSACSTFHNFSIDPMRSIALEKEESIIETMVIAHIEELPLLKNMIPTWQQEGSDESKEKELTKAATRVVERYESYLTYHKQSLPYTLKSEYTIIIRKYLRHALNEK